MATFEGSAGNGGAMAFTTAVHTEIEAHLPALQRFAKRLVGPNGDIEDLVQDTILRALNSSSQFRAGTALKSWLFTIMRNAFYTAYNRRKREHVGMDDEFNLRMVMEPPQEWVVLYADLGLAMQHLPEASRRSLLMVASGASYDETALACGCEVGTVKSRVNRARKALSERFSIA
ncbi:RNA polymerase sigma factor [Agrobacterium vitis]|uniref:RNA polymerase sigma factor n=2 Tax=Rhizobium/Agrobacterium group TaxID=227290 RepID=B9K1E4_ALLAM|nr:MULTISPECIES: sigma-70 family RNA polymerase sigma factor [Rhizobium/Agrobacterium group]ACM38692.1 ECF family sigma factor [Allorhizobium ampelinum S4]BCH66731.1 RNA polymerase sigma factor [Agrobacterium vitis]